MIAVKLIHLHYISILKSILAIILLLLISLKPILYVGELAYFQLNIDYIIETYCINKDKPELECNGKCHLTTQLAKLDASSEDSNAPKTINTKEIFTLVFLSENIFHTLKDSQEIVVKKVVNSYTETYSFLTVSSCFKPPQLHVV